jgi:fibronectin type 3 domain-containing protein
VVGYNLYRGTISGGPYVEISSTVVGTSQSDNTVLPGQTYYYVVTAVDSTGKESTYSNQVKAVIPTP